MKKFIALGLIGLLTAGCSFLVSDELVECFARPMKDSVTLGFVAAFHKKEGRWPTDMAEARSMFGEGTDLYDPENDLFSPDTTLASNHEGALIIGFDPSMELQRELIVEAPNAEHANYMGTYRNIPGSKFSMTGTITVDPGTISSATDSTIGMNDCGPEIKK